MSADLLRRAAKTLRDHARLATSSRPEEPWTAFRNDEPGRHVVCVETRWLDYPEDPAMPGGYRVADMSLDEPAEAWPLGQAVVDSQYIALMHPPVAFALAAWFEAGAAVVEANHELDGLDLDAIDDTYRGAVNTARAILREATG